MKTIMKRIDQWIPYLALIFIGICFLLPLLWLLFASLDLTATQAFKVPGHISLENFKTVVLDARNQQSFFNSAVISVSQTCIVLVCSILAAYPLSRYELKHGQKITMAMLFLTSIPITAVMVPVYQLFIGIRLVDSTLGAIIFLSSSALPYGIWMMKNFLDNVPIELEEAAWTDGASAITSIVKVIIPLMIPGIFTVAMFTFIGSWGNFFVPFILLQSNDKLPAAVNIYRFFGQRGAVVYGQLAAYSVLYMMPVFILYGLSQKYMSQGFSMSGAAKG